MVPLHEVTSLFETPGSKKFPNIFTIATAPREYAIAVAERVRCSACCDVGGYVR